MKAYTKDIVKTIIKGKKRFFALLLITSLGVCMMSGLKAACDDLRMSADRFFDEQNMYDISIVSTMGLTEEDVEVLSRLPGIEDVEGTYSETVFTTVDGKTKQADIRMLSEKDINMPYLVDGEFPMREDEILVTNKYLSQTGKSIGDTIVIEEDMAEEDSKEEDSKEEDAEQEEDVAEEDEDSRFELELEKPYDEETFENEELSEEDMDIGVEEEEEKPNFLYTEYTIAGVVVDTLNVNSAEGGVSFRSTSLTDYTFFVLPEAVATEIYTAVYITLTGTDELLCYSDEYEARVDEIVTVLEEEVKADREKARYEEITGEALEKVDDAESEMNDKFAEAEDKILDAKAEIEESWSELLNGQKGLAEGEKGLAEAELQLEKAQRGLELGQRELEASEGELEAAWEELESGEAMLAVGETALEEAETTLNESEKALDEAEKGLSQQFDAMQLLLETEITNVKRNITQTEAQIKLLEFEIALLKAEKENPLDGEWSYKKEAELVLKEAELERQKWDLDAYNRQLGTCEEALANLGQQEKDAYQEIANGRQEIANGRQELADNRTELENNKKELEEGRKELEKAQADFDEAKQQLADGWEELEKGWEELEEAYGGLYDGRAELEAGQAQLEDGRQQYEDSVSEYQDKKQDALDKIAEARQEIEDLKMTEWYITTRTGSSGYINIKTDAECIESIGDAFPVLFLTVAILISLTTISRMVEEDRGLIGTYKALGFTNREIRRKYVVYALLASVFGGILGDVLGFVVLPEIIFVIFGVMYDLPAYYLAFNWIYGIGGIILFIIGIGGAAFASCNSALSNMPAVLMRPKPPKNGSRVLLERITPVWKRLSFLNKVTARNLFRYKKRLFMTLFGIAGCTSLLLAGYTIKDTITEMMPLQFEKTFVYDLMVVAENNDKMLEYIEDGTQIRTYINPMITNVKIINEEGREETVQMIVVPEGESLRGYINLYDKADNKLKLEDGDVFTTINVSNILGYEKGDTISIQTMDLETADVEVTEVVMNYLSNYVFMTQGTYEEYFGEFEANGMIALLNGSDDKQEAYAEELAVQNGILSAIATASFGANMDDAFRIINLVVVIVITLAAALAFVVLFTLSTTNISERERELATIKVLGFFDKEVHSYVNKETIILTSLGILLGMPLGKGFGMWLMSILDMPSIYFADTLYPVSYLIAAAMTIVFAVVVNFITDRTLDRINPVEALKSIE